MESRNTPPRTISDLLALSEIEEGSFEDLDQLLDTTIDYNSENLGDDATTNHEVVEILQSVEAGATVYPTLIVGENSYSVPSRNSYDTSAPSPTIPQVSNEQDLLMQDVPEFSSSSPIHPIPNDNSGGNVIGSSHSLSMSPTTLLNSLLSQSDIVLDAEPSERNDTNTSISQQITSLSIDDATFMNANMEMSKSVEISRDEIDASFLNTTAGLGNSGSDDDDGMNSFVTAREDGDGTFTVQSKESTVVTALIDNKTDSDEIFRSEFDDINAELVPEPPTVDSENGLAATIDRQIVGSVSFHQSTDTKYEGASAPLWEDDDPSTPKRSGREVFLPLEATQTNDVSTTIAESVAAVEHQNPIVYSTIMYPLDTGKRSAGEMGNAESACNNEDKIDLQGAVPLVEVSGPTAKAASSTIDRLSVPNLSEANRAEDYTICSKTVDDELCDLPITNAKIENENVTFESIEFEAPAFSNNARNAENAMDNNTSCTTNEPNPDEMDANNRSLDSYLGVKDAAQFSTNPDWIIDSKVENCVERSPFLSDENFNNSATDASTSLHLENLGNELKSLQVEFPSMLNKSQKRSDVSLSSASSTISHGSFHKTNGGNAAFPPAPDNDQQHRRNASNDSLPPRSPKKGTALLENQKNSSSATTRHYPSSKESDDNDAERVETKWIKQSLSIAFNPKRSIFAGKHDTNNRPSSLSPPGSPPEPSYADSENDDTESFHEETRTYSSSGIKIRSSPSLWDMMADCESLSEKQWTDKLEYVNSERGTTLRNHTICNDESIAESSVSPSETGPSKSTHITTKPSYKSDTSISSSVVKRSGINKHLSISQHSKSSYSSARSSQGKKEKRVVLTPFGHRPSVSNQGRAELDASSLGRYSSYEVSSPERLSMFGMHSSSPDLYRLNEESQSSQQVSPIKQIDINTFVKSSSENDGEALITEAQPHDILSPESLVKKYSLFQESEALNRDDSASKLQETLLEFSTIYPLDLPLRHVEFPSSVKFIGKRKWRQLVANWKHLEIYREMVTGTLYSSIIGNRSMDGEVNSECASTGRLGTNECSNIELGGVPIRPKDDKAYTTILRQMNLYTKNVTISSFLAGIKSFETQNQKIRHLVTTSGTNDAAQPIDILYDAAQRNVPVLTSIVRDTVAFASISNSNQSEQATIIYAIDVKDRTAIDRKAKRKYGGDIFQVKDVLRSQITFRNDRELVCGLIRLLQKVNAPTDTDVADTEKIMLIRIKNLLSCNSFSELPISPLPTGYRHVLLNFRLPDGLIFELQLNLLPIFMVLGQEGYSLHRLLCDMHDSSDTSVPNPKTLKSFDMNDLIAEMVACNSGKCILKSFFDNTQESRNDKSSSEAKERYVHSTQDCVAAAAADINSDTSRTCVTDRGCNIVSASESIGGNQPILDDLCNTETGDILLAILQCGSNDISQNPRDFAFYWCIYALFSFVLKIEDEESISSIREEKPYILDYARRCLLQCLTISNQSISTGMTGWFEYGSSSEFDLFTGRPFSILQKLAHGYASDQRWAEAESLCRSLVLCCEQHLPLHHPTTLTSLLDLSISSAMIGNHSFADRILNRAAERLSKYLFGMENLYISHLSKARSCNKPGQAVLRIEHGRDAIFELHAFASLLQKQLNRDMVSLVGMDNEVVVANRCLVADTLSVLANCTAAAHFFLGSTSDKSDDCGRSYWRMAYRQYELCYNSLAASKDLDDPFVIRSLYGVARCLREFGETENALKLLSIVISFKSNVGGTPISDPSDRPTTVTIEESKGEDDGIAKNHSSRAPRFLPISTWSNSGAYTNRISKSMSSALCLWLMSILSVDAKRDEEGRERAFGFLYAASLLLQASLHEASDSSDDSTRAMCLRFLSMIEDEAEQISEPMYE